MSLQLGDVIENSLWITGDEPEGMKERYKKEVLATIDDLCTSEGFIHGPISFYEKRPGEDLAPEVPDHIQGSRVRLLIIETTLVKKLKIEDDPSFVSNLDYDDLMKLREITRKAVLKNYNRYILDDECDEIIEMLGPDAAVNALRTVH